MARCLDCDGAGQDGGRDCPTCGGNGDVDGGWADDVARDLHEADPRCDCDLCVLVRRTLESFK